MTIKAQFGAQTSDPQAVGNYSGGETTSTAGPRGGNFAAGAMGHAIGSEGLQEAQQRYADLVPKKYTAAADGVLGRTENVASSLSTGLSPSDPRSQVFNGERWTTTSPNGRAQSTALAEPQFQQEL